MKASSLSAEDVSLLRTRIRDKALHLSTTQAVAQAISEVLYGEFRDHVPLIRVYLTVPFCELPVFNSNFVSALATAKAVTPLLRPTTPVLSLVGTCGREFEWSSHLRSRGHVGIPLVGSEFVDSIPMISRLLIDLGVGLRWLDAPIGGVSTQVGVGALAGKFFVEDAATTVDSKGRLVIPAQDFVQKYGIKSVFGIGGTYLSPADLVTVIFFTQERLQREQLEAFMPLLVGIKAATARTVLRKHFFRTTPQATLTKEQVP
jgi:hypothetical protein